MLDKRFPQLRRILHTSTKQQLSGMSIFADFPVYDAPHDLNVLQSYTHPYSKKTFVADGDELVALSQYNIINTGYLVGHQIGLNEEDIVFTTLLPHTSQGLSLGLGMVLPHKVFYSNSFFAL